MKRSSEENSERRNEAVKPNSEAIKKNVFAISINFHHQHPPSTTTKKGSAAIFFMEMGVRPAMSMMN